MLEWKIERDETMQFNELYALEGFCGMGMSFAVDGFRLLYIGITAILWIMTSLFSREYFAQKNHRNRYYLFNLLTLGAVIGIFLSGDLFTTFIFFEIMSFTSYVWVIQEGKKESLRAGDTYLGVAIIGGLVMLMGIFLLYDTIGTLTIGKELIQGSMKALAEQPVRLYIAGGCLLFGFGAKAGAFPLHIWLPNAYVEAPAPATALLSGILSKTGIFGILITAAYLFVGDVQWGMVVLWVGLITMLVGGVLAILCVDMKRILAYSSMSQIGFILLGIGMQCLLGDTKGIAVRGTILHMVNHSFIKLVLFMIVGVVIMNLCTGNLNKVQGFGRKKPLLHFSFLMGALSMAGIPLWSGYISKTLLHESITEYITLLQRGVLSNPYATVTSMKITESIFLLGGGLTIAYLLKIYVSLFIMKNKDSRLQETYDSKKIYMTPLTGIAIAGSAMILPAMGLLPKGIMNRLADMGQGFLGVNSFSQEIAYFSLNNMKGAFTSILIGAILFVLVVRVCLMEKRESGKVYPETLIPYWMSLEDSIYRPLLLRIFPAIGLFFSRICDTVIDGTVLLLRKTVYRDREIPHEREEGTAFTHGLGVLLDGCRILLQKVTHKEKDNQISFSHRIAIIREEFIETNMIIGRSLSFGLFLFCLGLCTTLIYLLWW